MIRAIFLFSLFLALPAAADGLPSPPPEVATPGVPRTPYPALEANFAHGVRGIPDVPYWSPQRWRPLKLDLYLPGPETPRPEAGFPLIVYIHGGAWVAGTSRGGAFADFPGLLATMASRGYVVAAVNYRLSGEAKFPAQIQDVKAAIRYLRIHASEYGINPGMAITWGSSAGAHLAALAGTSCGVEELSPRPGGPPILPVSGPDEIVETDVSDCVQGAVAWYGIYDFANIADQARDGSVISRDVESAPEWQLLGCMKEQCSDEILRLVSPTALAGPDASPMLLLVGDDDTQVPTQQTLTLAGRLEAAGVPHELRILPGVDHNFVGQTVERTREANLEALDATLRFIDKLAGGL